MSQGDVQRILYVKEGDPMDARFRMFLNGLYAHGFRVDVIDGMKGLLDRLYAFRFECVVVFSGCCYAELLLFLGAIELHDTRKGRHMRMIVMVHPEEELKESIMRDFAIAQNIDELRAVLEIAKYQLQEERRVAI